MKKRVFALAMMGMMLLAGCGSEMGSAPGYDGVVPLSIDTGSSSSASGAESINNSVTAAESAASDVSFDGYVSTDAASIVEAPASSAAKMEASAPKQGSATHHQQGISGVLTAAEYSDLDNWDYFQDLVQNQKITFPAYGLNPTNAVSVTITDNNQQPLCGETVTLLDVQGAELWKAMTDADGKAWLFYDETQNPATVSTNGQDLAFADTVSFVSKASVQNNTGLQVMFILDTTGSMGDELNYLKEDFSAIVNEVGGNQVLFSANFYRDENDEYVTKCNPFTANTQDVQAQFDAESAKGGGDMPEAVADILYETMMQANWQDGYNKVAFLIFDAPPHTGTEAQIDAAVRAAAEQGIHLIPVVASNADRDTELFGRALAIMTNSEYVFLTDDSGVGESHLEPIIGNYSVESLHDIIVRLIREYQP